MTYQVLARKWRPKTFSELVGQEHVVRALRNALETRRTHHAYLFAGTRGIGKTTIARIFAKSINCEAGESAEPCGSCSVCTAVDAGRFVDLLEIDAASNTGVDDVRELIENAQYAPSRGRFKVYLIDEVHMLSRSAFNALLKTLEEPPEHVKFLLATTDPDKLPMTVLSRCLQFNLKRLQPAQIGDQLEHILGAEQIRYEAPAVQALATAADGSMRDGLSLLDQALAYGGGELLAEPTRAMLGTVDHGEVLALLEALAAADGAALLERAAAISAHAPDFAAVLGQLARQLHRVQLQQLVPGHRETGADAAALASLADRLDPAEVQLWYQLATRGRRELELAPDATTGFEMVLLRLLAFRPEGAPAAGAGAAGRAASRPAPVPASAPPAPAAPAAPRARADTAPAAVRPAAGDAPLGAVAEPPAAAGAAFVDTGDPVADWHAWVAAAGLSGLEAELARNAVLRERDAAQWTLAIPPQLASFRSKATIGALERHLAAATGVAALRLRVVEDRVEDTPAARQAEAADARQAAAERAVAADAVVQAFEQELGAQVRAGSVRPLGGA